MTFVAMIYFLLATCKGFYSLKVQGLRCLRVLLALPVDQLLQQLLGHHHYHGHLERPDSRQNNSIKYIWLRIH